MWLNKLGAKITEVSLPSLPVSLYEQASVGNIIENDIRGNICDTKFLNKVFKSAQPDIVIHIAAGPWF